MSRSDYEDILEPRRNELSTWAWSTRALNTRASVKIEPRPTPLYHKYAVLKSPKITELINQLCRQENASKEEIEKRVLIILNEIGYAKTLRVIRFLSYALTKILLQVCSGVHINHKEVHLLKSAMGKCPVIFVPSHRSYADFIIFSYVCFYYDIEIPAIAAGMDFHGMMGMGEMLRNTGAFFMRRSYNDDQLYWATFKEYVYQLVSGGDLPIEFFIEGTRSRSNKSLAPKYGLINMILKAYFLSQVPDIVFVPLSINYDKILEENLFAFELLGIPKPPETTSGFFKSMKILKEKYGDIYFHFGQPISTRDFFQDKLDRTKHSTGPIHLHEINEEEKRIIPSLAYEIIRQQQLSTVLSHFNLVALILNNNITRGQELTPIKSLENEIEALRDTLRSWKAKIFERDVNEAIKQCLIVHGNLIYLNEHEQLGLVRNKISIGELSPNKLKAHSLTEETISYSVPFIMLQVYANPVLHYFVDASLIVIVLRSLGKLTKDDLYRHFCTLRVIFSYEFVLLDTWYKMNFEDALSKLTSQRIIICKNDRYDIFENNYFEEVLISSIQPFILAYYVVAEVLLINSEVVEEKTVLVQVQKLLEEAIGEKKVFVHPYCMSLDTLGNCLTSFGRLGIIKKTRRDGKNVYQVNKNSLEKLKFDLEMYIPSFHVIKGFDIFSHIKSKL